MDRINSSNPVNPVHPVWICPFLECKPCAFAWEDGCYCACFKGYLSRDCLACYQETEGGWGGVLSWYSYCGKELCEDEAVLGWVKKGFASGYLWE